MKGKGCKTKNPSYEGFIFWVKDGARTRDPQNHNLVL